MMGEMDDFERELAHQLEDADFRKEWEAGEEDFQIRLAIVRARSRKRMSQVELARASGMDQRVLSRIETGAVAPTLKSLRKIARGLGKVLSVSFVDPAPADSTNT